MKEVSHAPANLWGLMTPIEVDGRHMGNVCLGQFFYDDESPDYDFFKNRARQYGFDEKEYLAALDRVPRWTRATVTATMDFCARLAKMISTLSCGTINLSRALSQKDAALTIFEDQPELFDLVITDQTVPGMTGVELARRMLAIRPDIPIILCTGYSNLISEEKIKALGIRGFALKPLTKKEIAVLIRKVLDYPEQAGR